MKKKVIAIVLAAVVLISVGIGAYLWIHVGSPGNTLKKIVSEVQKDGIKAVEPHLTDSMKKAYDTIYGITQSPLVQLLSRVDEVRKVLDALDANSRDWTAELDNIKTTGSNSSITLHITGGSFSGNINVEMKRENGQWLISDVSIPVANWVFN